MSPASGSCLLRGGQPEVAEQQHNGRSRPQHPEVPWRPEAQAVSAGGDAGRADSPGATGETPSSTLTAGSSVGKRSKGDAVSVPVLQS